MNKIEITVWVNLIHLKLIFKKNKKKILFTFTFTWTMQVQLINCTSFSEKKLCVLVFQKKKKCSLSEQCAVEHGSTVEVPFPPREAAKCCFSKPAVQSLILVGPTSKTQWIFLNQTLSCVAAGDLTRSHTPKWPLKLESLTCLKI